MLSTTASSEHDTEHHHLDALWLTLNPSLKRLDQCLISQLASRVKIARWEYLQELDEACCMEMAIAVLHEYLQQQEQPLHLLGHGINGVLGLIYAHRYPQNVRSLTLLSVSASLDITWHSHYYAMRELLPCSREMLLAHLVRMMFGQMCPPGTKAMATLLEQELDGGFAPHSLVNMTKVATGEVEVPIMVCYGRDDVVVDPNSRQQWKNSLKPTDRFWECPVGRHFFHFEARERVASQIYTYWHDLARRPEFAIAGD